MLTQEFQASQAKLTTKLQLTEDSKETLLQDYENLVVDRNSIDDKLKAVVAELEENTANNKVTVEGLKADINKSAQLIETLQSEKTDLQTHLKHLLSVISMTIVIADLVTN